MSTINFGLKLTADGSAFVGQVRVAKAEIDKLTGGIEQGAKRAADATEKMGRTLTGLAGIGAGAFGVSEVLRYAKALADTADAATNVRSKLALVAGSSQNTAQVYSELFRVAQESRVEFTDLANTYAQISRSAEESGISQERMLKVTQALSQAITVSGGSAQATQAAMVQLSQGLSAGALRGEELNSILEQTPRVAQAIAQGLGVGIGQLRKLGEEGKLTAEAVVGALERSAPQIAAEFAKMTPTIGQAFVTLSNSGLNFIGVLDQMAGASSGVAKGLIGMSSGVDSFASAIKDNPVVMAYLSALKFAATGGIGGAAVRFATRDPNAATAEAAGQNDAILGRRASEASAANLRRSQGLAFAAEKDVLSKEERRVSEINELSGRYVQAVSKLGDNASETDLERLRTALRQGIANIDGKYKERSGGGGARTAATDRRQALQAELADERAAVEFSEKLKLSALESLGKQGLRTDEQLVAQRAAIQQAAITQQIEVAQRLRDSTGSDASDRARASSTINALMRERVQVEQDATQRLAELAAQRAAVVDAEAQSFRKARFDDIQSLRDSVRSAQDEDRARRIAIATGRDEAEVLKEIAIERIEAQLAVDERPDPEKIERVALLREELTLLRERREIRENSAEDRPRARAGRGEKTEIESLQQSIEGFGRSSAKAFADYVTTGEGSFARVRDAFKSELLEMIAYQNVLRPLASGASNLLASAGSALLSAFTGGGSPILAGDSPLALTGDIIRGRRARGGSVQPRGLYQVNEEGPELLLMGGKGGTVFSADQTAAMLGNKGSGSPVNITQNVSFGGGMSPAQQAQALSRVKGDTIRALAEARQRGATV